MKRFFLIVLFAGLLLITQSSVLADERFFHIQSIDTMKQSRDLAREKLNDDSFQDQINKQVERIAQTGATHIAVGTPYEEEFVPFLTRWVQTARKYGLNVWFRGNLAGWEEWFDYPLITQAEHTAKIQEFIRLNKSLFKDGDLFTSCPECENGGPGDPRETGKTDEFRSFLIAEHEVVVQEFRKINKNVQSNLYSMNADVARLIMDKPTTAALGGIVTIDHYVKTPEDLAQDAIDIAELSGGSIVFGEFGVPIHDIHGTMTEDEQKQWIADALRLLAQNPNVVGINYWVNRGGSTQLWDDSGNPRAAVLAITEIFSPPVIKGEITDDAGLPLRNVTIAGSYREHMINSNSFTFPVLDDTDLTFTKEGYVTVVLPVKEALNMAESQRIILSSQSPSLLNRLMKLFHRTVQAVTNLLPLR